MEPSSNSIDKIDFDSWQMKKEGFRHPELADKFTFRNVLPDEADQTVVIEQTCFPPNEACREKDMRERVKKAPERFLVAVDNETGRLAGFLNGIATDETKFRDEFFTDIDLYDPAGQNIMLLGLDVLPEYEGRGIASELMRQYLQREHQIRDTKGVVILTCLEEKIKMYEHMGFKLLGISDSVWGDVKWYDMAHEI